MDEQTKEGPWALDREAAFVRRCRQARERQGMSQRELSRRLGDAGLPMHPSSVAKLERDDDERRPLRLAEAIALSILLGVPLWETFLDLEDQWMWRAAELTDELDDVQAQMEELEAKRDRLSSEQYRLAERDRLLSSPAGRLAVDLKRQYDYDLERNADDDGQHQEEA